MLVGEARIFAYFSGRKFVKSDMTSIRLELTHDVLIAAVCSIGKLDVNKALRRTGGSFNLFDHDIHQGTVGCLLR